MKKLVAMGIAVLVLALVAAPAMAIRPSCGGGGCGDRGDDLTIWNRAKVTNNVVTQANSGFNNVAGAMLVSGRIKTGDAGASGYVYNDVNYNYAGCDCIDGDVEIHNKARVTNNVVTQANSGFNSVGGLLTCGKIKTGAAGAGSAVYSFVNTNIIGGVAP